MTNRRRLRLIAIASLTTVVASLSTLADDVGSPFEEASAIQRQMRVVVDRAARATFAVTAFATPPTDERFFNAPLDGETLAKLSEPLDRSCGTAFAIGADGTLLTSEHVVSGAKSIWVTRDDGRVLPAIVVGTDPRGDLAILRVPSETAPLTIATDAPHRGDLVATVGNPAGLATAGAAAASVGTLSATNRALPALSARERRFYDDLLQVTTPLSVGNSGGPLVDLGGRAIGVLCATVDGTSASASIGYAVALNAVQRDHIDRLRRGEEIVYGYLGVTVADTRIDRVDAKAPAAGVLMPGDVVKTFDGVAVESDAAFYRLASATVVGRDVPLVVDRGGQTLSVAIRPTRREPNVAPVTTASQQLTWAGVTFVNAGNGVSVAKVADDASTPFKVGSVVRSINGASTPSVVELLAALHAHSGESLDVAVD